MSNLLERRLNVLGSVTLLVVLTLLLVLAGRVGLRPTLKLAA